MPSSPILDPVQVVPVGRVPFRPYVWVLSHCPVSCAGHVAQYAVKQHRPSCAVRFLQLRPLLYITSIFRFVYYLFYLFIINKHTGGKEEEFTLGVVS